MQALDNQRQIAGRLRRSWLLVALFIVTAVPSVLGWRLISAYAAIPEQQAKRLETFGLANARIAPPAVGYGIAVTPDGGIFVGDVAGQRLLAFPDGTGDSGVVLAEEAPDRKLLAFGLALSPDDSLYLLDYSTGRVHNFDRAGSFRRSLALGSPGARCLAIAGDGSIYIGDTAPRIVRKYLPAGEPDFSWGDRSSPGSVAVGSVFGLAESGGRVYAAADSFLWILDEHGRVLGRNPMRGSVEALTAGPDGLIYASDTFTNRIWVYSDDGRVLGRIVGSPAEGQLFFQPRGIAVPRRASLYVVNESQIGLYDLLPPPGK